MSDGGVRFGSASWYSPGALHAGKIAFNHESPIALLHRWLKKPHYPPAGLTAGVRNVNLAWHS
jgi:hypothetical protein